MLVTRKGGKLMALVRPCKKWNVFPKEPWTGGLTLPYRGGVSP